jgi:hypothetical protein
MADSSLKAALAAAGRAQADLDRRVFHLKTLHEAAGEMAVLNAPGTILERFLLTGMGMIGAARGLALLVNRRTGQGWVYHRGLRAEEAAQLQQRLPDLAALHFPEGRLSAVPSPPPADAPGPLPADMPVIIRAGVEEPYGVVAAFGRRASLEAPDEADGTALFALAGVTLDALRRSLFRQQAGRLNADLTRQAEALEAARDRAVSAHALLDRQVFNLRTIYEFTTDAGRELATDRLLQRFLLTAMGALGVRAGCVLLCDRTAKWTAHVSRGPAAERAWTHAEAERLLYAAFQAAEQRRLDPMSCVFVRDPAAVLPVADMGFEVDRALLFTVDDGLIGLLALGATAAVPDAPPRTGLLEGLVASCAILLKNARAFETIQALNAELRSANQDLRQTIAELTEAQQKIRLLEVARQRLRSAIRREVEQAGRLRVRDLALMILLAAGLALAFNASNPAGIPVLAIGVEDDPLEWADPEEARRWLADGRAVLVDARPAELFQAGHPSSAINIPAPLFDIIYPMQLGRTLQPDQVVLVFGRTISRRYDEEAARRVLQRHDHVKLVDGRVAGPKPSRAGTP